MARNAVKMTEDDFKSLLLTWAQSVLSHPESEVTIDEVEDMDSYKYYPDPVAAKLENYIYNAVMSYYGNKSVEQIKNDLSKVIFDWENFYLSGRDYDESDLKYQILGYWTTESGVPVLGCLAGGDWEIPVHFVLYPETPDIIRAYMPKEGNTWNTKSKTAYGSEPETGFEYDESAEPPEVDVEVFKNAVNKRLKVK